MSQQTSRRPDPPRSPDAVALQATVVLSAEQIDVIARRAAEIVAERREGGPGTWMDTRAAEAYAGFRPGRLDDLKRLGCIVPAGYDGRKPMYLRADLDAYLRGAS